MDTDALTISGLNAFYGESHVLHDLSFNVKKGQVLGLLGRNGAGKTTCISAIMGLIKAKATHIDLFGQSIAGLSPEAISLQGVGLVPQRRRIFPSLTVFAAARTGTTRAGASSGSMRPSPGCRNASGNWPAHCPAANSRYWRSAGP